MLRISPGLHTTVHPGGHHLLNLGKVVGVRLKSTLLPCVSYPLPPFPLHQPPDQQPCVWARQDSALETTWNDPLDSYLGIEVKLRAKGTRVCVCVMPRTLQLTN